MKTTEERFWTKVEIIPFHECWEWIACKRFGYGRFHTNGKSMSAHRISWQIHSGEIPKGLKVLHRCDNTSCVRPDHLFLGTQKDNVDDMCKKGRHHKLKGSSHGASILNEEQVRNIRKEYMHLSQRELARKYGVGKTTIAHICNKTSWFHLSP